MRPELFKYLCTLAFSIFAGACVSVPEPEKLNIAFEYVGVTMGAEDVRFEAEISVGGSMVSECGFLYGESEDDMVMYPAKMEDRCFAMSITDFVYGEDYIYKAYIGNGQNYLYSDRQTFTAPSPDMCLSVNELAVGYSGGTYKVIVRHGQRYEVMIPGDVDWIESEVEDNVCMLKVSQSSLSEDRECVIRFVRQDDRSECLLHVVQDKYEYQLDLSSYETRMDGTTWGSFQIAVLGNASFEVIVPEDVKWVTYNVVGRDCGFTIMENMTKEERECLVTFRSLDHDCSVTHRIVQGGTAYECMEIEVSPMVQNLYVPIPPGFSLTSYGSAYGDEWVFTTGSIKDVYAGFGIDENNIGKSRSCCLVVYLDSNDLFYVNLIQHSYIETIDFKDPVVKNVCVDLWDLNADRELSFEEAYAIPVMKKEDFIGKNITSFPELRFMPDYIWSDYLFEGSSLVSASLPHNKSGHLRRGMFKDCRNLQNVDIGFRAVVDESFMNCTSLKEIDALIVGHSAFMGCTDLEKANQRDFYLPDKVFKNCTSLREVTFDKRFFSPSDCRGTIGKEAFYGCESLQELNIYRQINMIEDRAFYGCSSLKDVYLESGIPPELGEDAFTGTSPDLKFHVPASSVNAYKKQWPELVDRIVAD